MLRNIKLLLQSSALLTLLTGGLLLSVPKVLRAEALLESVKVGSFAPVFTRLDDDSWINSGHLVLGELTGKVVLLVVWNAGNWDSLHSFVWLNSLRNREREGSFEIVSVHSPEFPHERNRTALQRKISEFNIKFPIMLDDDRAYWKSLGSPSLPVFYLIDKRGRIDLLFEGLMRTGEPNPKMLEEELNRLITEKL